MKRQCTSSRPSVLTQARLKSLDVKEVKILKIIRALNTNKAHGYDNIFIRMIKYVTNHY